MTSWEQLEGVQWKALTINVGGIEVVKGIIRNQYKVVKKDGSDVIIRTLKKLEPKGVASVSALDIDRDKLFNGELGVVVATYGMFDSVVKNRLPERLVCQAHRRDVFTLKQSMWDSEIQNELGYKEYPSVEKVAISLISRALMHVRKEAGHELLVNGYANIELARAEDGRIVTVRCSFGGSRLELYCYELDEDGNWSDGQQVSYPALGA